jgi:hypothetical protein
MATQSNLQFTINVATGNTAGLGNLLGQTQAFQKALTSVSTQSRSVFLTLEELGQRYQQHGFMGRGDQQQLERSTQQWERMSRVLAVQRSQAAADLARIRSAGVIGPADRRAEARAEAQYQRLTTQQRGMAELERSYVFDNMPRLVAPSGPFSPWAPPGQPRPPVPPQPGGAAPVPPAPPSGRGAPEDVGASGALMASLGALMMLTRHEQSGFPDVVEGGMGGKGLLGGGVLGGALGFLGGIARQGTGLAIGLSAMQHLSQAMQAYETRHVGILTVGRQLDTQYEQIGDTLTYLQRAYQVTGREGVQAMSTLGRVTGTVAAASLATTQAMRVARAVGMAPEAAAQMQAQLIQYSPGGTANPLALVGAYTQAQARGELQRMSFGRFGEAVTQIAGVGGFGRAMGTEEQYAEQARMMAAFGGRYEANPAGAFAEYYARQYGPKSEMGEVINFQAMADVMRTNPQGVQWRGRTLNPRTSYIDQQILMQQGAEIDEYRAAQFARARQQAGGNRDFGIELYMQATGTQDYAQGLREYEALAEQERTGGIAGRFRAPGAAQTGEAVVAGREAAPYRRGQEILERQMTPEELALTGVVKILEDARSTMLNRIQTTAEAFNTTTTAAEGLVKIFTDLTAAGDKLKTVADEIAGLPGRAGWQPGVAAPLDVDQWLERSTTPYPRPPTTPLPTQPRKTGP